MEGIKSTDEASKNVLQENWQKELAQIEQGRNHVLPEHEKTQEMSRQLQSLEDRLVQSRKSKHIKRNEQARKLAVLRAGEGRRGSAMEAARCLAAQAQQLSIIQGEIRDVYGMPQQPGASETVHQGARRAVGR